MKKAIIMLVFLFILLIRPFSLVGHCDTMGGPVIKAAQKSLDSGNINYVLIWIKKEYETELKQVFNKAIALRELSQEAKEIADMYFFETVVRLHRMGEGAPYTGIKIGEEIGPIILAADKAIEQGSIKDLLKVLNKAIQESVSYHFKELLSLKRFKENDVEAGRKYVEAYVYFTHLVEKIYQATKGLEAHEPTHNL